MIKRHAETSFIGVEQANPRREDAQPDRLLQCARALKFTTAYEQQVHHQLDGAEMLPVGPVALELSFIVGPWRS